MKITMSSKIRANMLHGKESGSHYRGSMTGMRWPLTPGKNGCSLMRAEQNVEGEGACKIRRRSAQLC